MRTLMWGRGPSYETMTNHAHANLKIEPLRLMLCILTSLKACTTLYHSFCNPRTESTDGLEQEACG